MMIVLVFCGEIRMMGSIRKRILIGTHYITDVIQRDFQIKVIIIARTEDTSPNSRHFVYESS